ncbi:MAG: hypothetical protein ACI8O8_000201, partial [Oleiphilaceae bacterium]
NFGYPNIDMPHIQLLFHSSVTRNPSKKIV